MYSISALFAKNEKTVFSTPMPEHLPEPKTKQEEPKNEKITVTAQQIHEDFYREAERLLQPFSEEMELKSARYDVLERFGLYSVKCYDECYQANFMKNNNSIARKYADKYPGYKFLTEQQVKDLCLKYGLCLGSTGSYKGDIPMKNLDELSLLKLDPKDYNCIYVSSLGFMDIAWIIGEYGEDVVDKIIAANGAMVPLGDGRYSGSYCHHNRGNSFVVAPPTMFSTENTTLVSGYKLIDDDPIFLHQVTGGYLLITAWGDEAKIPEIVNEKMN